jgi:hypothetical protein
MCLSSQDPEPVSRCETWSGPLRGPLFGLAPDGVFRASALALGAVGSYPTFSPLPRSCRHEQGGLFSVALSVGTPHSIAARVYLRSSRSYTASRPLVFGLSSPSTRSRERLSALPKSGESLRQYEKFSSREWRSQLYSSSACSKTKKGPITRTRRRTDDKSKPESPKYPRLLRPRTGAPRLLLGRD